MKKLRKKIDVNRLTFFFSPQATYFPLSHTLANSRSSNYNTSERGSQVSRRSWAKIGFDVGNRACGRSCLRSVLDSWRWVAAQLTLRLIHSCLCFQSQVRKRELKQCEQTKISSVMLFACAAALCLSRAGYMGFSDRGARRDGN